MSSQTICDNCSVIIHYPFEHYVVIAGHSLRTSVGQCERIYLDACSLSCVAQLYSKQIAKTVEENSNTIQPEDCKQS